MEKRTTIIDYLGQVLSLFGFSMLFMAVTVMLVGEDTKSYVLFSLGNKGIAVGVMFQFLLLSAVIIFLKYVFFTEWLIKKMSVVKRTIMMGAVVFIISSVFFILFQWFPITLWQAWIRFFICFIICFIVSILSTAVKNYLENKKLKDGLNRLQEQWGKKDEK